VLTGDNFVAELPRAFFFPCAHSNNLRIFNESHAEMLLLALIRLAARRNSCRITSDA
jgi:hypothetical protein